MKRVPGVFFIFLVLVLLLPLRGWSLPISEWAKQAPSQKDYPYASAVILEDDTTVSVKEDGSLVTTEHRIIKILNPKGLRRYGELRFLYSSKLQTAKIEEAKIIRSMGREVLLSQGNVQEATPQALSSVPAYAHMKVIFLPFTQLDPGGLLEYRLTIEDKPRSGGHFWQQVFLQETDPILKQTLTFSLPKGRSFKWLPMGVPNSEPQKNEAENVVSFSWSWENVPPLYWESSMPAAEDVAPRMIFTSLDSWDQVGQLLHDSLEVKKVAKEAKEKGKEIVGKIKDPMEKAKALYLFLATSIKTVPLEFGKAGYPPQDLKDLLKAEQGDGKDKALLLQAMLKEVGIDSQLVALSTSSHGSIKKEAPAPMQFNALLVWVPSLNLWLDPARSTCAFGYLPPEDQGREAYLISERKFVTTPVLQPKDNREEIVVKASLSPTGGLEQEITITERGANNLLMRELLSRMKPAERSTVIEAMASQIAPEPKISNSNISPLEAINDPFSIKMNFSSDAFSTKAGDLLIFPLPLISSSRLGELVRDEPKERKYPFVIGSSLWEEKKLEIALPQGYRTRVLPKGETVENPIGSYSATFGQENEKMIFKSTFILQKPLVSIEEYGLLKKLVEAKVKVEQEKIVLEKAQ